MDSKFSMKEIYRVTRKPVKSNILSLTAENQTLKKMLEEACHELNSIFKYKKKLIKKKGGKFILAPREYKNVVKQMETIRKNDADQYTNLMREFKQSIKQKKSELNQPMDISDATVTLFSTEEKQAKTLKPELPEDMQTLRVAFLKELGDSLAGNVLATKKKKRKRCVRKMKKQRKFNHIKNNLERFLSERDSSDSSFDEITPNDVDEAQFDFCDDVFPPCRRSVSQSFTDSIQMIKQKKFKLRKTKRFRKECEYQVNKDTAFQRALSEIGFRRKYFELDEETDEEFEL